MERNAMYIKNKRSPKAPSGGSGQARSFDQYRCKDNQIFSISKQKTKKNEQSALFIKERSLGNTKTTLRHTRPGVSLQHRPMRPARKRQVVVIS